MHRNEVLYEIKMWTCSPNLSTRVLSEQLVYCLTTAHIVHDLRSLVYGFGKSSTIVHAFMEYFIANYHVLECALLTFSSISNRLAEI